ncbi:hypothetical protein PCC82_06710 [Agrobacterium deltaense]
MADLPILFSAPMVRALIAGTKTQTRRTFGKLRRFGPIHQFGISDTPGYAWHFRDGSGRFHDLRGGELLKYLPYKVGDRLYVREAWRVSQQWNLTAPRDLPARRMTIFCEAGGSIANQASGRWEPDNDYPPFRPDWVGKMRQGMHMPKWASRITLIVEGVKVERLRDISEADAIAEGADISPHHRSQITGGPMVKVGPGTYMSPIAWYHRLWDDINGAEAWNANPWVVAYTFRRIMGNIDMIEAAA